MLDLPTSSLRDCFAIGIAGNFAGHLEQAGEAVDFAGVSAPAEAPKGIFPVYLPGGSGFLATFPFSSDRIAMPDSDLPLNLQIEPEAGVLCDVEYEDGLPARLRPSALGAFNDCSIRREGARKISEKKNWGADSEGFAARAFAVEEIDPDGATATLRLACFLRRGDETFDYGVDSPLPGYSYYGSSLLDWIVDRLRNQTGSEDSPLEPVGEYLAACGSPQRMLIGIGATRYSDFGERNFLRLGDESIVVIYDSSQNDQQSVHDAVTARAEAQLVEASVLVQSVERG
jgi:hypothetical protein